MKIVLYESQREIHTVASKAASRDLGLKYHPKDYKQKFKYPSIPPNKTHTETDKVWRSSNLPDCDSSDSDLVLRLYTLKTLIFLSKHFSTPPHNPPSPLPQFNIPVSNFMLETA